MPSDDPIMQLPLDDGRAVRMIVALLNAADPLDRLGDGPVSNCYEPLAVAVLAGLRDGADARRLILLINEHAGGQPGAQPLQLRRVAAFAHAVRDWWTDGAARLLDSLAM